MAVLEKRPFLTWRSDVVAELRDIKLGLATTDTTLKEIRNNMKNVAKSHEDEFVVAKSHEEEFVKEKSLEEEVVLGVYNVLLGAGFKLPEEPLLNHEILDPVSGETLCCPDGLIFLGDGSWAVVEIRSLVDSDSLSQVERVTKILTTHGFKISKQFVGGPAFEKGSTEDALAAGVAVVQVTGERWKVIFSPQTMRNIDV